MQYDVHAAARKPRVLLLDCQSDLHRDLNTRFVVPLAPISPELRPASRLHPIFEIDGEQWIMLTTQATTVAASALGAVKASLREESYSITAAIDVLLTGV